MGLHDSTQAGSEMTDTSLGVNPKVQIPDALWERIQAVLPPPKAKKKPGRPRMDDRTAMTAMFAVLRTGCQWEALPRSLGAPSTVHDRFQEWQQEGVFAQVWRAGVRAYDEKLGLDWEWQSIAGAIPKAPLGGKRNRTQSDRSGHVGHQAQLGDGGVRHSHRFGGGRG